MKKNNLIYFLANKYLGIKIFIFSCFLLSSINLSAQIGYGTAAPQSNTVVELKTTKLGFLPPRLTTEQRDAITNPTQGLLVYNIDNGCLEWFFDGYWTSAMQKAKFDGDCEIRTSNSPNFFWGRSLSEGDLTQEIALNVTRIGQYDIVARPFEASGVRFVASGAFLKTGLQTLVLVGLGKQLSNPDLYEYKTNTSPTCTFSFKPQLNPSSNGSSVIFAFSEGEQIGSIYLKTSPVGVTKTINVTVTQIGTYNITTDVVNGISFSGVGTFSSLGYQTISLVPAGSALTISTNNYKLMNNLLTFPASIKKNVPIDGFSRCDGITDTVVQTVTTVVSGSTLVWMDRNLGASRAANSVKDYFSYGCMFQWGRGNDGHGSVDWSNSYSATALNGETNVLLDSDDLEANDEGKFVYNPTGDGWRYAMTQTLWQGVLGINNPCPSGFRLPTAAEVTAEALVSESDAYASNLKIPSSGSRKKGNAIFLSIGTASSIWTSTWDSTNPRAFIFNGAGAALSASANGRAVRCVKNK